MDRSGGKSAAGRPSTSPAENDAIDILKYNLDNSHLEHDIKTGDKYPNHDGFIEIFENNDPVGRITVQVKKLPDRNIAEPKKQFEVSTLRYSDRIDDPFILIVVDIINEIGYWKEIPWRYVENEGIGAQKTRVIHFSNEFQIDGNSSDYIDKWKQITDLNHRRIKNYDRFKKLQEIANPAIGDQRSEFQNIHKFLDSLNSLFHNEFSVIREQMYPELWQAGYANIHFGEDVVRYGVFHIQQDENDAQIKDVSEDEAEDIFDSIGAEWEFGATVWNPIRDYPREWAYSTVGTYVRELIENRHLDHSENRLLAQEYVSAFLQDYSHVMGLSAGGSYSVDTVKQRYSEYMRYWLDEYTRDLDKDNYSQLTISLPSSSNISKPQQDHIDSRVRERIKAEESPPPRYRIRIDEYDSHLLEEFLNLLVESGIDVLSPPFSPPDLVLPENESGWIWDQYSRDAIIGNIELFYLNHTDSYNKLVEENFPEIAENLYETYPGTRVVTYDFEDKSDRGEPLLRIYHLDQIVGEEEVIIEDYHSEIISDLTDSDPGDSIQLYQSTCNIKNFCIESLTHHLLLNHHSLFEYVYDKLEDSLDDYIDSKKPSFSNHMHDIG